MISFTKVAQTSCVGWTLSNKIHSECSMTIGNKVLKEFNVQDFLVVDFLYQSFAKDLKGVIVNEEHDFNRFLQLSGFLNGLYSKFKDKSVLIICPENVLTIWHYFVTNYSGFKVHIVTSESSIQDKNKFNGVVLLLNFLNLNLIKNKIEHFVTVVIDSIDMIATKLVMRKLQGIFNIGLTSRNFYVEPDQKLQWSILNWANPGCVNKLKEFYQFDNENFANLRDNYKEWWFRLTWDYSDDFIKPSKEDKEKLHKLLNSWEKGQNLSGFINRKIRNRRLNTGNEDKHNENKKRKTIVYKAKQIKFKNMCLSKVEKKSCNEGSLVIECANNFKNNTDTDKIDPIYYITENVDINSTVSGGSNLNKPKKKIQEESIEPANNRNVTSGSISNPDSDDNDILSCLIERKAEGKQTLPNKVDQLRPSHKIMTLDESDMFLKNMFSSNVGETSKLPKKSESATFIESLLKKENHSTADDNLNIDKLIEHVHALTGKKM